MPDRATLKTLFDAGIQAVGGRAATYRVLQQAALNEPVWLVSLGKAASHMALGARDCLGERLQSALLVTKHDHLEAELLADTRFLCIEAGHPTPDEHSLRAGAALLQFLATRLAGQPGVVLISGGTSALVEALIDGWTLESLQVLTTDLLANGVAIGDMNRLRQRISRIKGGRLARALPPGVRVLQYLISDVPGDVLSDIGSGLLVPSLTSAAPAQACQGPILPGAVGPPGSLPALPGLAALGLSLPNQGENRPPAPNDPVWARIHTALMASNTLAREAVAQRARVLGLPVVFDNGSLDGDVEQVAERMAATLLADGAAAGVYIWGGEPTVRLPDSPGRGGRNQHLALRLAQRLQGAACCRVLVAGTDGSDGPTGDAGGIIDPESVSRGIALGLDIEAHLQRADAGSYLAATGDLFSTGPTGTNVMDLAIAIRAAAGRPG